MIDPDVLAIVIDRLDADLRLDAAREAHRRDAAMIDAEATDVNELATEQEQPNV